MSEASTPAEVVAACVNVLADHIEHLPPAEIGRDCQRVLEWAERFESAPGRSEVTALTLALTRFNQGLAFLGLGERSRAQDCFREAQRDNPLFRPPVEEAIRQPSYGPQIHSIAERLRGSTSKPAASEPSL
jgi:hypothetical protein